MQTRDFSHNILRHTYEANQAEYNGLGTATRLETEKTRRLEDAVLGREFILFYPHCLCITCLFCPTVVGTGEDKIRCRFVLGWFG